LAAKEGALTGPRLDLAELMLSSTGRIGRAPFLIGVAALLAAGLAYRQLCGGALHRWTAFVVYCALLFSLACLVSKRLHDRGRAGWWGFLVVFAVIGLWSGRMGAAQAIWAVVLAIAALDLGLMPGQPGFNRFGAHPGREAMAKV
jgi:uncharacterized membrane protein YhaH (DUF805 family)